MTVFFKIIIVSFLLALIFAVLKTFKTEYAYICLISGGICILIMLIPQIKEIVSEIKVIVPASSYESIGIFLKCTLICEICALTKSFCRDSSGEFLASCIDIAEKTAVVFTAFPLMKAIVQIITQYIGA